MDVLAPLSGNLVDLKSVPDDVFAAEIVGSGLAIDPLDTNEKVTIQAPVGGKIIKFHPHAFVILTPEKKGILVHVGINTINLKGEGFTLLAAEGDTVEAGTDLLTCNPNFIKEKGLSPVVPVVLMDSAPGTIKLIKPRKVEIGEIVFKID